MRNKYFILRHGETTQQTKKLKKKEIIYYNWPSLSSFPLTKKGKKAIESVAKKLKNKKIDLIYSSDSLRTRQTAEIVAKELGLKVNFDPRLRDINLGTYQGREKGEFYKDLPLSLKRFSKKVPKGESWSDVKRRVVGAIKDIDKKHKGKTILIVSHGDPLWLLEGAIKGLTNQELLNQIFKKKFIKMGELRELQT